MIPQSPNEVLEQNHTCIYLGYVFLARENLTFSKQAIVLHHISVSTSLLHLRTECKCHFIDVNSKKVVSPGQFGVLVDFFNKGCMFNCSISISNYKKKIINWEDANSSFFFTDMPVFLWLYTRKCYKITLCCADD